MKERTEDAGCVPTLHRQVPATEPTLDAVMEEIIQ